MVYAGGVIVVPLHGGRLQALTADTLTTVWVTDELASDQQSLGTLTVRDGYVYAGTSNDSGSAGYLTCVSLADGSIRWSQKAESGFYWAGSVAMGDYLVTGNDKGEVYAYDPATGKTAGTPLALDSSIRMTLVSDGTYIYAISSKGVLYQLSVSEDGEVSVAKQVQFGKKSTSTPAIVNGKLVFGGTASSWKTALFVYDAATLTLEHEVTMLTDGSELPRGSSQSAPLVSVQDGAAYAYFTVNNTPGGVYRYKLGDSAAELIYAPVEGQQNYCMNSVIAGPDGTLYYVNDSGTLFAVGAVGGAVDPKPDPDPEPKPDPDPEPAKTAALTVSNTVKGSQSAQQQAFSYTVELRGGGAADVTGTYGDLDFKAGVAAFTLTGGQSKKATDLPAGLSYIVTQVPVDGFASNQTVFEGVLKADGSFTAAFENTQDEVPATVTASASIVGVDGDGKQQTWAPEASFDLAEGATAADLTEALFRQAGITADYDPDTAYGWYLKSITSPSDPALTLGYDYETGDYWQFFVNGEMASVGASSYVLQPGDTISWVYGHDGLMPGQISASIEIIGQDANGLVQRWAAPATIKLTEGATAADLSEALFRQAGITADYGEGTWGWYLNTITSPFDGDLTLGTEDMGGGRWAYWRLFVNGEPSQLGAGGVELKKGDAVSWVYTAEDEMPDAGDIQVDPTAPRPDYEASHPGFAQSPTGGNVVKAPTPTTGTTLNWTYALGAEGGKASSGSDPLIVNGDLYVVSGSMLRVLDRATGTVKQDASGRKLEVSIGANMGYFCRPVYTDGLIIVPREDGSLVAFTADALTCVWQSAAPDLPSSLAGKDYCYQALSSLMVNGGYVYAGFTVDGNKGAAGDGGFAGALVCVDIDTGRVVWSRVTDSAQTGAAAGYYWAGAAPSGDDIVIGDESGSVQLIDGATGAVLSTVEGLGGAIRAGVVAIPGQDGTFLAVSRDNGTLYKLVRTGNALAVAGKVAFAAESTSTPAVADGQAFVCGVDAEGYGTLSIIDLASMRVVKTVRGGQGKAQSAPLVSQTANGTYVYFTCNGRPGGVYSYRVGDTSAVQIYEPDAAHQQYTTSSVIADEQGNLYYTNDSGTLFSLKGALSWKVTYDTLGGSPVRPSYVVRGGVLSRPADPTRAGYTFKGWYTDKACTETWDFEAAVTGDMTLYAKWEETADSDNGQEPGGNGGHDGNGGQHGSGDSNQNASSDANGSEDGGDGKAPVPAGTVAPGEAPLSQAESEALESQDDAESDQADGDDSEAADDATGQEHGSASAGDTLSSSSERAQAHQAAATFGLPLAALIAGLVGAIGLIAAIILFLMGKRGKGSHA